MNKEHESLHNPRLEQKTPYCSICCNATVEPELTHDNDLSVMSVGEIDKGYNLFIRTGNNKPTALIVSKWEEKFKRNFDIGIYKMKFCPECGRRLIENEKILQSS